jgi:hypothetical protein
MSFTSLIKAFNTLSLKALILLLATLIQALFNIILDLYTLLDTTSNSLASFLQPSLPHTYKEQPSRVIIQQTPTI